MKFTKETVRRMIRTFIQAAIGFIASNIVFQISGVNWYEKDTIKAAAIGLLASSLAAGAAAVMNLEPKRLKGEDQSE